MDSNPRYRSEWRKSRRVRELRGIKLLSGERVPGGVAVPDKPVRFLARAKRRMAGDSVAKSGLYDTSQAARLVRM